MASRHSRVLPHVAILFVLSILLVGHRFVQVRESLPYYGHVDEKTWANVATDMLQRKSANPKRFRKPSLPVYVMTAGFVLGLGEAKLTGKKVTIRDLGNREDLFYPLPSVVETPKRIFVLFAVGAMVLLGVLAFALVNRPVLLWLPVLFSALSPDYTYYSWRYMGVDVVGAFFAMATLAYLLGMHALDTARGRPPGGLTRAIVVGVLAGLTVGSKYNLFPILLPCAAWFLLFERQRFFSRSVVVGAVAVATFLLTTPYAVLDWRAFIADVMKEATHYATGHISATGRDVATVPRGPVMAWKYIENFGTNYGWVPLVVSLAGAACLVRRSWRTALVALTYPVVFIGYMSMQRVFFERNGLVVHLFIAFTLALALLDLPDLARQALVRFRPGLEGSRFLRPVVAAAIAFVVILGVPWAKTANAYAINVEPRNTAVRWVRENADGQARIIVSRNIKLDVRTLPGRLRVAEVDPKKETERLERFRRHKHLVALVSPKEADALAKLLNLRNVQLPRSLLFPNRPTNVRVLELKPPPRETSRRKNK